VSHLDVERQTVGRASGARPASGPLVYSDGLTASRIILGVKVSDDDALQRRLPEGWQLAPWGGSDARGAAFNGINLVIPFHDVAVLDDPRLPDDAQIQPHYVAFLVPARNVATAEIAHFETDLLTGDPAAVPGKYRASRFGKVTREHTRTTRDGHRRVQDLFSVDAADGLFELSMAYEPGGVPLWLTADEPNFPIYSAIDPEIVRWYKEDAFYDVLRSVPLGFDRVSEFGLDVTATSLRDIFDGGFEVVGIVAQPTYVRRVFVPPGQAPASPSPSPDHPPSEGHAR
jgi:hypothetical protein